MMRFVHVTSMLLLAIVVVVVGRVGAVSTTSATLHLDIDQLSSSVEQQHDVSATTTSQKKKTMLEHYQPPCAADEEQFEISGIPGTVRRIYIYIYVSSSAAAASLSYWLMFERCLFFHVFVCFSYLLTTVALLNGENKSTASSLFVIYLTHAHVAFSFTCLSFLFVLFLGGLRRHQKQLTTALDAQRIMYYYFTRTRTRTRTHAKLHFL